jgi:ESCRT-II complex subunit VPS36
MSLIEAYCYINRVNRLHNFDLISPEDLLNACKCLDNLSLPICMITYKSGLVALQLRSKDDETIAEDIVQCVNKLGSANPSLLSRELNISVVLAMERYLYFLIKN